MKVVLEHMIQGSLACMHAHGGGQMALVGTCVLAVCTAPLVAVSLSKERVGKVVDDCEMCTWAVCHMRGIDWAAAIVHERVCSRTCPSWW